MKKNSAFTLIEVLVAMLVLAIGLLGLAGMTVVVLRSNTLSQQISEATTISSDLMETLKRQAYLSLPDCIAANTLQPANVPTNCDMIRQSGLYTQNDLYPPLNNTACVISNVLSVNTAAWDYVTANLVGSDTSASTLCGIPAPGARQYIRYYRTYNDPSVTGDDRTMSVVVLWRDKFNKWRRIYLSTTRTQ